MPQNASLHEARTREIGTVHISARFLLNGSGASPTTTRGKGLTLTRTGTGVYLVTTSPKYPKIVAAHVTLQRASGDWTHLITALSEAAGTVEITTRSGATATDFADGTIHVTLVVRATGLA